MPILSSSQKKKRRKLALTKLIVGSAVLVVVITGTAFFIRSNVVVITGIDVTGNEVVSNEEVISLADSYLSRYLLWVIPRRNVLLYPKDLIKDGVLLAYPRVSSVNVSLERKKIKIEVEERKPHALWCIKDKVKCFFIDKESFAFAESPEFSTDVYRSYFNIGEAAIGSRFLPKEDFEKLDKFIDSINLLKVGTVFTVIVTEDDVTLGFAKGGGVIKVRRGDYARTLKNLELFLLDNEKVKNLTMDGIEYIDAGVGNKIFYKLK